MKTRLLLAFFLFAAFDPALFPQQLTETLFGDSGWNAILKFWQMPGGNIAAVASVTTGSSAHRKLYHFSPEGTVLEEYELPAPSASIFIEPSPDGTSFFYGRMGADGYIIHRMNLSGQTLDSIVYHPGDPAWNDYSFAIRMTPGGHFVLAYKEVTATFLTRVVRLDPQGNVVFNKTQTSDSPDIYYNNLEVTPAGRTIVFVHNFDQPSRLLCYSPAGVLLWNKTLPYLVIFADETFLLPMDDGSIAVYARYGFDGTNLIDGYALRYTANGNLAYTHTFENELPAFQPYHAFSDGNQLVIAGDYQQPGERGLGVIKLDADGQTIFNKKFNQISGYTDMKSAPTANGDYVFCGSRYKPATMNGQTEKGYVLCLQPDGTVNWFDTTQTAHIRQISGILHRGNGDLLLAGSAYHQPLPAAGSYNLLLRVSGLGPVLAQLIEGKIWRDSIEDCEPNPGEPHLDGWVVQAETPGGNRYGVSDAEGYYSIRLNTNSANLSISTPNDLWQPCQALYPLSFSGSDTASLDISVQQIAQCPFLSLDASSPFLRRCFDNRYYFDWCNTGTADAINTTMTITLDAFNTFVDASEPPAAQNGQELTFQLGNIAPGECGNLTVTVHISCDAALGQMHCLEAKITADEICPGHTGYTFSDRECQANTGSFDPNDKRAFVNDTLREGPILPNTDIGYQIRFQNTGTDTAFNIVVVDTISNTLDISTLRAGVASHPYSFQLHGSNIVKFVFNNIQLPDSNINEAASHGFVNFSIAQKPDLPLLTEIRNKADIYFDYNNPVATNQHKLVVNESTSAPAPPDASALVEAWPNPTADGLFWLESRDAARSIRQVSVFDAAGRLASDVQPLRNKVRLELPDAKGVYLVKIYLDDGRRGAVRMVR